jgi:tetratricopeptide (TPR) repeat protein
MKLFLLLLACCFGCTMVRAEDDAAAKADWARGTAFYKQHNYDSAVACFGRIAAGKPSDAVIYLNLGNAYYRQHQLGYSILNYQRALLRDPQNQAAKDNLVLAQSRIPNAIPVIKDIFFVRWAKFFTNGSNATQWALVALLLCFMAVGLLFTGRLKKGLQVKPQLISCLFILSAAWIVLAFLAAHNSRNSGTAVVMQDVPFQPEGSGKAAHQTLVPEGTTVSIEDTATGSITLPDGRTGTIAKTALLAVD